jgi:hypothetical protein
MPTKRFGIPKFAKFVSANISGGIISELILLVGLLLIRLLKFEGINGVGSSINVLIQLLLLGTLSLSPALGNIVGGGIGSVAAYAIIYLVSMRFVWRTNTSK